MKKSLFTLAFAVLGLTASYAQKNDHKVTPEQRAEKSASAMQQKLSLSDEQKSQIKQIEMEKFKQGEGLRKSTDVDSKNTAQREERKAAAKTYQDKIKAVLTPEQQKILADTRVKGKDKLRNKSQKNKGEKKTEAPVKI